MPELPEVETVVRDLAPLITGSRVLRLEIIDPKLSLRPGLLPRNRVIQSVRRYGKEIVLDLSLKTKPLWLGVHLRMTGRLIWRESLPTPGERHLRARVILNRGNLLFIDARRFGVMRLLTRLNDVFTGGTDPLSPEFTRVLLADLLARSKQELKPWLLRQDRLVGLGNIYASEILFAARLHPCRRTNSLSAVEVKNLHHHTQRLLQRAIKYCGTTISDFQDGKGRSGRFQRFLKVYGREKTPCSRCCRPITRLVQQGRSTFFCPACQRMRSRRSG